MTRARTHIRAVGISPLIQPLLEAVLCVVVSLVHRVVTTFGMRLFRRNHDWHMAPAAEALPQTKPDIHQKASHHQHGSFSGKRSASRESRLEHPKGQADTPLETINRDSRDKPENDPGDVAPLEACPLARVPGDLSPEARRAQGEGRDPDSAQHALPKRTALSPLILTNVGIQGRLCALSRPAASSLHTQATRSWIPTPHPEPARSAESKGAGMSGESCLQSA